MYREHVREKPSVLFVDDDIYQTQIYADALLDDGFEVESTDSVVHALELARKGSFDAFLVDVMMPHESAFQEAETAGGFRTGIALARELAELQPDSKIVAFTNSGAADVQAWFTKDDAVAFLRKSEVLYDDLPRILRRILNIEDDSPEIFIVHGHDRSALLELKNFLQNCLGLPEPRILAEQPSRGLTLIEKFEKYALSANLVFVLVTPDDVGGSRASQEVSARPRPNVVFEYGYFLGALRRHSGRVILLKKGELELPSDLSGIVYVDITNGIEAEGETLRRELKEWL